MPYAAMTLKGWVWYQGENDMHGYFGNSALGTGYSCLMPALVSSLRKLWAATPGKRAPPHRDVWWCRRCHDGGTPVASGHVRVKSHTDVTDVMEVTDVTDVTLE